MKRIFFLIICGLVFGAHSSAQTLPKKVTCLIDFNSPTKDIPKIFAVNLNLLGSSREDTWPAGLADKQAIEKVEKEMGLTGTYRLKWDFWQIGQLEKDKEKQKELLQNYEEIIQKISRRGGTVILSLVNMPPGFGKVLDKRSVPENIAKWRALVKETIKELSCEKKYNIWYEVWDNPTDENSFLGTKKDYFDLYRAASRAITELEKQYNIHIPIGAAAVKNWYENFEPNTALIPERSLIYDLLRFCAQNNLPLDFLSWHSFSTDPAIDKRVVAYNRDLVKLIRTWLNYFNFKQEVTLVIDAWNWGLSDLKMSDEHSYFTQVSASYIPARLKNMYEADIERQVFYTLADLEDSQKNTLDNRGLLFTEAKGAPETKAGYSVWRFLALLGDKMYSPSSLSDDFMDILVTRRGKDLIILIWNYIDPLLLRSQIEKIFLDLNEKEQNILLEIIKSDKLKDILNKKEFSPEVAETEKLKQALVALADFYSRSQEALVQARQVELKINNIVGKYKYSRYVLDEGCALRCLFKPQQEEKLLLKNNFEEDIELKPYSVVLIILNKL